MNIDQFDEEPVRIDELIGQEYRRKYVICYVVDMLEKYVLHLKKAKRDTTEIMFIYVSFLFEILQISTKSFSELYSFQNTLISTSGSIQSIYYTQILLQRCNIQFEHFFKKPVIQNQRLNIMAVITFNEKIEIYRKNLSQYLQEIGGFFDFLCSNFIDLLELEKQSVRLYQQNKSLIELQLLLFDICPNDRELIFLSTIYNFLLDFENKRISDLIRRSKNLTQKNLFPSERSISVFVKNSCVVYASFNTIDGKITKVSKSFQKVYDIENKDIIGKTINALIPKGLYGAHDDLMKNFRNKGTMNVIMKGERMVFGLNGRGYIIPLMIRLKLENIFGEFGVCSLLTRANVEKDYLFFSNEGDIMDISENLYKQVFSQVLPLNKLRHLNINDVIPLTYGIQELQEFGSLFYSILIIKSTKLNNHVKDNMNVLASKEPSMIEDIVNNISSKDTIYNIGFRMSLIPTSLGVTYKFVEIESFKKETNRAKKVENIQYLQECIQVFLNIHAKTKFALSQISNIQQRDQSSPLKERSEEEEDDEEVASIKKFKQPTRNKQNSVSNNSTVKIADSEDLRFDMNINNLGQTSSQNMIKSPQSLIKNMNTSSTPNHDPGNKRTFQDMIIVSNMDKSINLPTQKIHQNKNPDEKLSPLAHSVSLDIHTLREHTVAQLLSSKRGQDDGTEHLPSSMRYNQDDGIMEELNILIGSSPTSDFATQILSSSKTEEVENDFPGYRRNSNYLQTSHQAVLRNTDEVTFQASNFMSPSNSNQKQSKNQQHPHLFLAKKLSPMPETPLNDNPNQEGFQLEQSNSYKVIMENKRNVQNKEIKEHNKRQSLTNSQQKLLNYNKMMMNSSQLNFSDKPHVSDTEGGDGNPKIYKDKLQIEQYHNSSTQEEEMRKEENDQVLQEQERERSSIRSSQNSSSENQRKDVIKKIRSQTNTNGLKIFIATGIFSFSILICLTIIEFSLLISTLDTFFLNFKTLNMFNISLIDVQRTLANDSYRIMNNLGAYNYGPDLVDSENDIVESENEEFKSEYVEFFLQFMEQNSNQLFQTILLDHLIEFKLYNYDMLSKDDYHLEQTIIIPVEYSYPLMLQSMSVLEVDYIAYIEMKQMWENELQFVVDSNSMQDAVEKQVSQQFSAVTDLNFINLFVTFGVAMLLSFTLLPLSYFITTHREHMLQLFGTFSPEKIQKHIDLIQKCLESINAPQKNSLHLSRITNQQYFDRKHRTNDHQSKEQEDKNLHGGKQNHQKPLDIILPSMRPISDQDGHENQANKITDKRADLNLLTNIDTKNTQQLPTQGFNSIPHTPNMQSQIHTPNNTVQSLFNSNINNNTNMFLHSKLDIPKIDDTGVNLRKRNIDSFSAGFFIKRTMQKRSRSMASFSSIPKIGKVVVFAVIAIILLLLIFPITSLIVTTYFKKETDIIILERIILLNAQTHLYDLQANHYGLWLQASLTSTQSQQTQLNFHLAQINKLVVNTSGVMQKIQTLTQYAEDHKYDFQFFKNTYENILQGDICALIEPNLDYIDPEILTVNCIETMQGMLQRGLIISFQKCFAVFTQFQAMYSSDLTIMSDFMTYLSSLQDESEFVLNLNWLCKMVGFVAEGMDSFSIFYLTRYYDSVKQQQTGIFAASIVVIFLLFSVGWTAIYFRLRRSMMQSKNLLTLLSIELIMENSFFIQYFKSHSFGISH